MAIPEFMIAFVGIVWQFLPLLAVMWGFAEILRLRRHVGALNGRVAALEASSRAPLAGAE